MGLFSTDKAKIRELEARIEVIATKQQLLETNMASLRGLINRKMGKNALEEVDEEEKKEMSPQDLQRALMGLG